MKNKLFVISGCSGVGKGTILKRFIDLNKESFILSISCTTRKPRLGEVDGESYFFVSKEIFEKNIIENKFLEYAQFADNFYGTKKRFIIENLENNKNVILEIDTKGALQVKSKMPDAVLIFIAPPSFEELEKRLRGRHTEDEVTINKRLKEAKQEFERSKQYDYIIVNDNIDTAMQSLNDIVNKELL